MTTEKQESQESSLLDELLAALPVQKPTVEDNSQDWAGMGAAVAWQLIERHADNWADIEKMLGEWLAANTLQAVQAEREACAALCDEQAIINFNVPPPSISTSLCDEQAIINDSGRAGVVAGKCAGLIRTRGE